MRLPRRRLRAPRRLATGREAPAPPARAAAPRPSSGQARSQESTVELAAVPDEIPPSPPTVPPARGPVPRPPQKIAFDCLCGANLVATADTYDKHSRCALCQTILLLSLVYDGDCRSFEIVPFPVEPRNGS